MGDAVGVSTGVDAAGGRLGLFTRGACRFSRHSNKRSAISLLLIAYRWLVRDHARDAVLVGLADHLRHIALALTLGRLRGQDVTLERLTALDLAGSRLLESLGSAGMGFHLWHFCSFGTSTQHSAVSTQPNHC